MNDPMNELKTDYATQTTEWLLKNLLALIHRDGGNYTARHGIGESCKDAETLLLDYFKLKDAGKHTRTRKW